MDRQAIARARRREQALEALEFERARAVALCEQLEAIVVELEGPAIDASVFARMEPADVEVVRPALQAPELDVPEEDAEWLSLEASPTEPEAGDPYEEEIARLEEEIAGSRRRQQAFERYLESLTE